MTRFYHQTLPFSPIHVVVDLPLASCDAIKRLQRRNRGPRRWTGHSLRGVDEGGF